MSWDGTQADDNDDNGKGERHGPTRSNGGSRSRRKDAPPAGGGTVTSPFRTGSKVPPPAVDFGLGLSLGIGW